MNLDYYSPFLPENMLETGDKQSQSLGQKDTTQANPQRDIKLVTFKNRALVKAQHSAEPEEVSSAESSEEEGEAETVPALDGAAEEDGGAGAGVVC